MAGIKLENICKIVRIQDQDIKIFNNLNLEIPDSQAISIMGPTGCGKSTLLRIIAGLEKPDSGSVYYDSTDMGNVKPEEREIGIVFQNDYALYPRTARFNVLSYFKLGNREVEDDAESRMIQKAAELLGYDLKALLHKSPDKLSQGQRQRVAVARCITRNPRLLILDEPFSNLDGPLRLQCRTELKKLIKHFKITTIFVAHEHREAMDLGNCHAILNQGRVAQFGTYNELYDEPNSIFVAEFLTEGENAGMNLFDGESVNMGEIIAGARPEEIIFKNSREPGTFSAQIKEVTRSVILNKNIIKFEYNNKVYSAVSEREDIRAGSSQFFSFRKVHKFNKNSKERI
ncbi:MAG: ABC transporter ATP-binding protein [bacterium]